MTKLFTAMIFLCCLVSTQPLWAQTNSLVVVGDSLSAGYGLERGQGWVDLLRQRLQSMSSSIEVINASISGDTSRAGLQRLPTVLELHRPDIVIIELGANDGLRGLNLDTTQDNLRQMIELSRAAGAKVLLIGVRLPINYGKTYRARFHTLYTELAEQTGVAFMPTLLLGVAEDLALMQADGLHPTAQAQPRLLENVWPALQPLL